MRQVVFRKQARLEFDEAGDWYEKERHGLGMEFLSEIQSLIQRITSTPEQFPMLYRDVRKAVARRFPLLHLLPRTRATHRRAGGLSQRTQSSGVAATSTMNNTRRSIAAAPEPKEHPVLGALRDVQPDELSPKAALENLYQLKKLI